MLEILLLLQRTMLSAEMSRTNSNYLEASFAESNTPFTFQYTQNKFEVEAEQAKMTGSSLQDAKKSPVHARILWPALGFPSVIAPDDKEPIMSFLDSDATRCVCVLLLSDRENLLPDEVARYLRYIPWENRHSTRHIPYGIGQMGTFSKDDLYVRKLRLRDPNEGPGQLVHFGENRKGANGIIANLANPLLAFYFVQNKKSDQIPYKSLFEVRVSETASWRLNKRLYHIFWNNEKVDEKAPSLSTPSDEMSLLIKYFAVPRRRELGTQWEKNSTFLKDEYEYEFGYSHYPYKFKHGKGLKAEWRTEILHPLFVRDPAKDLRISHLTDLHIDVRADVYEENLKRLGPKVLVDVYNNWNKNFLKMYDIARGAVGSDVLLLTGDLIDYGRGFIGLSKRGQLADNELYHPDRNWFLFYYLLASNLGSDIAQYTKPVYTCLGNHDWRLNPYPPFAFSGAPDPESLFNEMELVKEINKSRKGTKSDPYAHRAKCDMRGALRLAHGPGYELLLSYDKSVTSKWQPALADAKKIGKQGPGPCDATTNAKYGYDIIDLWQDIKRFYRIGKTLVKDKDKLIWRLLGGVQKIDIKGFPTETNLKSVEWYLLLINPFLDYQFAFPGGFNILMLDWPQKENVVFYNSQNGQQYGFALSPDEGPKASNCLSYIQKELVEGFTAAPGAAKIIGIHAPPIGPWPDWYDNELLCGWNEYEENEGRGYQLYRGTITCNGKTENVKGHPFFAIRPKHNIRDAVYGMDAIYGSFEKYRDWFIRRLADPKYSVRVVLSGHIHRQGMFVTYRLKNPDTGLKDELLIRSIDELALNGQPKPASVMVGPRPLYVNTTSLGPRGHFYRSSIDKDKGPVTHPNPRYTDDISVPPGITIIEINNRGVLQKVVTRRL